VCALALSCGSGSGGTGASDELVAACNNEEQVNCSTQDKCEGSFASLVYGSESNCVTRLSQQCQLQAISPGATYGSTGLATCAANQAAQTCNQWIGLLTPGCGFSGTRGLGNPCRFDGQCASGFCDAISFHTTGNVCGLCHNPPAEGTACNSSCGGDNSVVCEHDASGAGTCVRAGNGGDSCDAVAVCNTGFACAIPPGASKGTCLPSTGNAGDACNDEAGPLCDYRRRIFCNGLTHVCAVAANAAPGAACGILADGSVAECAGGVCRGTGTQGVCVAYLPDGAACPSGNAPCAPPGICDQGTCRIVGGDVCD
jgi:hypothetical protein